MLYVSRYIWPDSFGVMDTDDGVEQSVTSKELTDAFFCQHLDIKGMSIKDFPVKIYQPPETKTQAQLKLEMLSHIETIVFQGMLVNIRFDWRKLRAPVSVRLSNFCSGIGDSIFRGSDVSGPHRLTLVFDDKIASIGRFGLQPLVCPAPHKSRDTLCVRFDFSEVTNEALVSSLYESLYARYGAVRLFHYDEIYASVIDIAERKAKYAR